MGVIAILVNCYLIGQCGQLQRLFPWLSPEMTIISIVLLEVCTVLWMVHAGWFMKSFVVLMHRYCSCFPQVTPFNVRKEVQKCAWRAIFCCAKPSKLIFFKSMNEHKISQEFLLCVWGVLWKQYRIGNGLWLCLDVNCMLSLSLCGLGGLQHFAILLKYIIHVAIPDIPGWVAEEMAKLEYRRREAFKV